jgi:hypothetical protein
MNLKLTAAAVLATAIAAPAFAQQDMSRAQVARHHKESVRNRKPRQWILAG